MNLGERKLCCWPWRVNFSSVWTLEREVVMLTFKGVFAFILYRSAEKIH